MSFTMLSTLRRQAIQYVRRPEPHQPAPPAQQARARRAQTPTVLQMEAVECGAASLAMILAYHGRVVPLEALRAACGVSRDGSKASNVIRAARTYGLSPKGFKKEPGQLRELPVPMIVHWNFNHFLVLEGFRKGKAYLNDPAMGPRVVSEAEFDQSFTGVALTFETTPEFERGGRLPGLVAGLRRRAAGTGLALTFVVLAGLALVVPGLAAPAFSKIFIDDIVVKGLDQWLRPLVLLMSLGALLTGGLTLLQQHYLLRLETRLSLATSGTFLWHTLRLPVDFFTQRYAGEIGNRVAINDRVARLLSGDLATNAISALLVVFYGVLLLQYDVVLTVIGVGMALLNIAALRFVSRRRADLNMRLMQDRGKLMGTAMGGLQTIETLKASGAESDFFAQWAGYQAKVSNADQQLQLQTTVLSAVPPFLVSLNTALMLGIGGMRVMSGSLTVGMLTAFQAMMSAFLSPVNTMVNLGGQLQEVKSGMERLDDVLGAPEDQSVHTPLLPPDGTPAKLSGTVELRDVSFGYSRLEPPLIEHFNLTLRPGSRVALVGGSGCGKSTVAKLVSGLYEPWSGEILFDGRPRREIARSVMTASLGVVDQDICLFEDSIRANLTLWDTTVTEPVLLQAASDACIHEDIATRNGGYGATLGEGGRNFSGGQRQRLEIARALVSQPTILVLDEATSALDPTTEQIIDDNLRRRGCTCLIVAHRLSTIRDCDEILVLDRGKILQRGTHAEMVAVPGPYRDLVAAE